MKKPTLEDWVWVESMLVQAMIGAISHNVRQIILCYKDNKWILDTILAEESEDDREEIFDIADEFSIFLEDIRGRISNSAYTKVVLKI